MSNWELWTLVMKRYQACRHTMPLFQKLTDVNIGRRAEMNACIMQRFTYIFMQRKLSNVKTTISSNFSILFSSLSILIYFFSSENICLDERTAIYCLTLQKSALSFSKVIFFNILAFSITIAELSKQLYLFIIPKKIKFYRKMNIYPNSPKKNRDTHTFTNNQSIYSLR